MPDSSDEATSYEFVLGRLLDRVNVNGDPQVNLEEMPITRKMEIFLMIHFPLHDESNPDLTKINCWKGIQGVFHYALIPLEWGLNQFVLYTLGGHGDDPQGVDEALASVMREHSQDIGEMARNFHESRPTQSVPTLGGSKVDLNPETDRKFNRILDALQALVEEANPLDKDHGIPQENYEFAIRVLKECGRISED